MANPERQVKLWWVYVLVNDQGRTYVGASVDPQRRVRQHNGQLAGGGRYTARHRPWQLAKVYGPFEKRRALRVERLVKKRRGKRRMDWPG